MVLVFDLDDTLYEELTFVKSGFKAVAQYLESCYTLPAEITFATLWRLFPAGRGHLFDALLKEYGLYTRKRVAECVGVYRGHIPEISLAPDAVACLRRFRDFSKYLVTDGNKLVQRRKIKALGIGAHFKHCYVTHSYGICHAKPSPYCFLDICRRERVEPHVVLYVGDNPEKDFVGIKPLGFQTVRIMRGVHQEVEKSPDYEADHRIATLDELTREWVDGLGK